MAEQIAEKLSLNTVYASTRTEMTYSNDVCVKILGFLFTVLTVTSGLVFEIKAFILLPVNSLLF